MRTARAVSEQETNTARTVREPQGEKEFIAEGAPTGSGRRRRRGRREELEEFEGPEVVDVENAEDAAVGVSYDDAGDFALLHKMEGSAGEFAGRAGHAGRRHQRASGFRRAEAVCRGGRRDEARRNRRGRSRGAREERWPR